MHIARTPGEVRSALAGLPRPLAFVPTMGALHAGHAALIDVAKSRAAAVAVSIFVNPLQFGPHDDFDRYPRAFEADCHNLRARGVALLYAPSPQTMYPPGFSMHLEAGPIGTIFEGARRPSHFNGVATVMTKLLNIMAPECFVMGQKDAQQVAMLRHMLSDFDAPFEMVVVPTVREADGLALSSRNAYLSSEDRAAAATLHAALETIAHAIASGERSSGAAIERGRRVLDPRLSEDYLAVVDPLTFRELAGPAPGALVIGAVRAGTTHLIDNVAVAF